MKTNSRQSCLSRCFRSSSRRFDAGVEAIEVAITIPIIMLLALGIFDFSLYLSAKTALESAGQQVITEASVVQDLDNDDNSVRADVQARLESTGLRLAQTSGMSRNVELVPLASGSTQLVKLELPAPQAGYTMQKQLETTPLLFRIKATYKPILFFLPQIPIEISSVGYREPRFNSSLPPSASVACTKLAEQCPCPYDPDTKKIWDPGSSKCACKSGAGLVETDNGDGTVSCACASDKREWNSTKCTCKACDTTKGFTSIDADCNCLCKAHSSPQDGVCVCDSDYQESNGVCECNKDCSTGNSNDATVLDREHCTCGCAPFNGKPMVWCNNRCIPSDYCQGGTIDPASCACICSDSTKTSCAPDPWNNPDFKTCMKPDCPRPVLEFFHQAEPPDHPEPCTCYCPQPGADLCGNECVGPCPANSDRPFRKYGGWTLPGYGKQYSPYGKDDWECSCECDETYTLVEVGSQCCTYGRHFENGQCVCDEGKESCGSAAPPDAPPTMAGQTACALPCPPNQHHYIYSDPGGWYDGLCDPYGPADYAVGTGCECDDPTKISCGTGCYDPCPYPNMYRYNWDCGNCKCDNWICPYPLRPNQTNCACDTCASNYETCQSGSTTYCVSKCSNGKVRSDGVCGSQPCVCPTGQNTCNDGTCCQGSCAYKPYVYVCVPACPAGQTRTQGPCTQGNCGNCVCSNTCPSGSVAPTTTTDPPCACSCDSNNFVSCQTPTGSLKCVPKCTGGQTRGADPCDDTKACACPAGQALCGSSCCAGECCGGACYPTSCPAGQVRLPGSCNQCSCSNTCTGGAVALPSNNCSCQCNAATTVACQNPDGSAKCVPICTGGQTRGADPCDDTKACQCPAGQNMCGSSCCTGQCCDNACYASSCPAGQARLSGSCSQCSCTNACPVGASALPSNNCLCVCGSGYLSCTAGDGSLNKCADKCLAGQIRDDGVCGIEPCHCPASAPVFCSKAGAATNCYAACPENQVMDSNTCTCSCPPAPAGTVLTMVGQRCEYPCFAGLERCGTADNACAPPCDSNKKRTANSCACECKVIPTCTVVGQVFDTDSCQCRCPTGQDACFETSTGKMTCTNHCAAGLRIDPQNSCTCGCSQGEVLCKDVGCRVDNCASTNPDLALSPATCKCDCANPSLSMCSNNTCHDPNPCNVENRHTIFDTVSCKCVCKSGFNAYGTGDQYGAVCAPGSDSAPDWCTDALGNFICSYDADDGWIPIGE